VESPKLCIDACRVSALIDWDIGKSTGQCPVAPGCTGAAPFRDRRCQRHREITPASPARFRLFSAKPSSALWTTTAGI